MSDFHIIGHDYYPLLAYVDPFDYYDQVHENAVAAIDQELSSYLLIAKDHSKNSILKYRVELKLPQGGGVLGALSPFEREAIRNEILKAINEEGEAQGFYITNNAAIERKGLAFFKTALENLQAGTFNLGDAMGIAGFTSYAVKTNETYDRASNGVYFGAGINPSDYVYDYTGLEVSINGNPILLRDMISSTAGGNNFILENFNRSYIVTDSDNTISELDQAEQSFLGDGRHFVMWVHHRRGNESAGESDSIYVKSRNNLTEIEAEIIVSNYVETVLNEWMPEIETSGGVALQGGGGESRSLNCSLNAQWGKTCLLEFVKNSGQSTANKFKLGIAVGVLDGLIATLKIIYDLYAVPKGFWDSTVAYCKDLWVHYQEHESLTSVFEKIEGDIDIALQTIKELVNVYNQIVEKISATNIYNAFLGIITGVGEAILDWFNNELLALTPDAGYGVGVVAFDVILTVFSGGGSVAAKGGRYLTSIASYLKGIIQSPRSSVGAMLSKASNQSANIVGLGAKIVRCKILGKGCFIKDTPVLMASNSFTNSGKTYALAATMPFMALPIQEVPLLSWTVAHETVNQQNNLIVSTDEDFYFGTLSEDSYTSPQQRQRDQYKLDDTNWHEVIFEQVHGTSIAKLALHTDWITQNNYQLDAIVNMNLPEQGISGPFRITSIKHLLPQKRPVDEDAGKGFVFRPVTGIFIHESDDVWTLEFDSGDTLGVTANHPIYSTTAQDWRLTSELAIGEQVLTYAGSATLTGKRPAPAQRVYNLEVQEVHNFLVTGVGVVVHNSCWDEAAKYASGERSKSEIWELKDYPQIFKRGNIIEKVMRKGKYSSSKGWGFTGKGDGGLGYDNYWLIDFHKGNKVVSLKSTKLTNGTDWANSNADHIGKLSERKIQRSFPNCKPGPNCQNPSHVIGNIDDVELHIIVEDISQINQTDWINSIKSKLPPSEQNNLIITISEMDAD